MLDPIEIEFPQALRRAQMTLDFLAKTLQTGIAPAKPVVEMTLNTSKELDQLASRVEAYFLTVREERWNRRVASMKAATSRILRPKRRRR